MDLLIKLRWGVNASHPKLPNHWSSNSTCDWQRHNYQISLIYMKNLILFHMLRLWGIQLQLSVKIPRALARCRFLLYFHSNLLWLVLSSSPQMALSKHIWIFKRYWFGITYRCWPITILIVDRRNDKKSRKHCRLICVSEPIIKALHLTVITIYNFMSLT